MLLAQQLPGEPAKQFGTSITGVYEGWFENPDGSRGFLVGYMNRNRGEEIDVPIGPNNRIEPGGPDMGQPEHFLTGRQSGVFAVPVPKNFGPRDRLVWTITVDGQTTSIPLWQQIDYNISPLIGPGRNTPPHLRLTEAGKSVQGPAAILANAMNQTVAASAKLPLTAWIDDDMLVSSDTNAPGRSQRPPVSLTWAKYRGPGAVTFEPAKPMVDKLPAGEFPFRGKGVTSATFSAPGDYVLHLTVNDFSGNGGGGFQCCWTTALVKVSAR